MACCFLFGNFSFLTYADSRLKLSQEQGNLSVLETRQVQLECVVLNRTSAASQLLVEWFVWKPNQPERETVARLSRDATFHYGEQAAKNNLKGRLVLLHSLAILWVPVFCLQRVWTTFQNQNSPVSTSSTTSEVVRKDQSQAEKMIPEDSGDIPGSSPKQP